MDMDNKTDTTIVSLIMGMADGCMSDVYLYDDYSDAIPRGQQAE